MTVATSGRAPRRPRDWPRRGVRLLLTSATLLFVELLLIRWIPSQVRYIGFFSNFLLMASFLGIGLGILLGRRGARWSLVAFPLLLLVRGGDRRPEPAQRGDPCAQQELFFGLTDASAPRTPTTRCSSWWW